MKKVLFFSGLLFLQVNLFAQIPNNGFESWRTAVNCSEPAGYYSAYSLIDSSGTFCPVTQSTDHYPADLGNYSVRMENNTTLWNSGKIVGWGLLTSSRLNDKPLFPISGHPTSLCGYYKFLPQNGDTMNVWLHLYFNGTEITMAHLQSSLAASNWTPFQIPVSNLSYASADSARIVFSPSNEPKGASVPRGNSVLYVDNLSFDSLLTGVTEENMAAGFLVYPEPVKDILTIQFNKNLTGILNLFIYDEAGRSIEINDLTRNANDITLDVQSLPAGIYFYEIRTKEGIARNKFVKE